MILEGYKELKYDLIVGLLKSKKINFLEMLTYISENESLFSDDLIGKLFVSKSYNESTYTEGCNKEDLRELIFSTERFKFIYIKEVLTNFRCGLNSVKVLYENREYIRDENNGFLAFVKDDLSIFRYGFEDSKSIFLKFLFNISNPLSDKKILNTLEIDFINHPCNLYYAYLFMNENELAEEGIRRIFIKILNANTRRRYNTRVLKDFFKELNEYGNDTMVSFDLIKEAESLGIIENKKDVARLKSCVVNSEV